MIVNSLVVDAAPLIKSAYKLGQMSSNLVTVPEVMAELRDEQTRQEMERLPFEIKTRTPSEECMRWVIEFSKLTGDFAALSLADIKLLALTLQLEIEANGQEHLRRRPKPAAVSNGKEPKKFQKDLKSSQESLESLSLEPKEEKQSEDKQPSSEEKPSVEDKQALAEDKQHSSDENQQEESQDEIAPHPPTEMQDPAVGEIDDDSSDGEWITPSNVQKHKEKDAEAPAPKRKVTSLDVACISNDFAVQNMLLQIGLGLVNVDGLMVTRVKNWVLRCHACYKVTKDMSKIFCPSCGNSTLLRTSCAVEEDGTLTLYLKKNFQYNNRGTQYSIPQTQMGKHAHNLILREDQREFDKAMRAKKRLDKKMLNDDVDVFEIQQSARLTATGKPIIGYGRKNVNEAKHYRRRK
ncbi:Nin one binding Zn-ribbon like-domain-containing protein [Gorgonomyces haynaldii]|nr:Nin one binding Zn-ribbon like-domain-containing protein [Gorgonomyces haynaldii]